MKLTFEASVALTASRMSLATHAQNSPHSQNSPQGQFNRLQEEQGMVAVEDESEAVGALDLDLGGGIAS